MWFFFKNKSKLQYKSWHYDEKLLVSYEFVEIIWLINQQA